MDASNSESAKVADTRHLGRDCLECNTSVETETNQRSISGVDVTEYKTSGIFFKSTNGKTEEGREKPRYTTMEEPPLGDHWQKG